jgi:hypothetical protein
MEHPRHEAGGASLWGCGRLAEAEVAAGVPALRIGSQADARISQVARRKLTANSLVGEPKGNRCVYHPHPEANHRRNADVGQRRGGWLRAVHRYRPGRPRLPPIPILLLVPGKTPTQDERPHHLGYECLPQLSLHHVWRVRDSAIAPSRLLPSTPALGQLVRPVLVRGAPCRAVRSRRRSGLLT